MPALLAKLSPYFQEANLSNISLIAPLTQGLSNDNYYVRARHPSQAQEAEWVLRLNSWASSQICNRDSEVANWRLASDANLAPKIVYVSLGNTFYVSEFFAQNEQSCWSELMAANSSHPIKSTRESWPGAERKLLQLLNGLQSLPLPHNEITLDSQWHIYQERLAGMQAKILPILQHGSQRPREVPESCLLVILKRWQQLYTNLCDSGCSINNMLVNLADCMVNLQYSHRDLNPYNVLVVDDKLKCIDFEYACSSHPLCDLAAVIASHSLSSTQRHWLISQYLKNNPNLNQTADKGVESAVDLYWVFAVCWALQMAFDSLLADFDIGLELETYLTEQTVFAKGEDSNAAVLKRDDYHSVCEYLDCAEQYFKLISSCT
ncbi:phosphotransferase [Shewanella marinintestina]|uniref:phosphotransferase n=1 Tax=Shewanella marinintestina TaxID=190305 RepID=UPI00200D9232|nr:phosphotransferase [Shewanella marinintestina]